MNRKDIVQALLKTQTLEVVVMGDSMYPVIHQQDVAIVEAVGEYNVGDIIVYQYEGEMLVHRIIKKTATTYFCKGDNAFRLEKIEDTDVVGKVCKLFRSGKRIPLLKVNNQFIEMSYKIHMLYLKNKFDKNIVKGTKIYKNYIKYLSEECFQNE